MDLVIILAVILLREINYKHVERQSTNHSCCDVEQRIPKRIEGWIELKLKPRVLPEARWFTALCSATIVINGEGVGLDK